MKLKLLIPLASAVAAALVAPGAPAEAGCETSFTQALKDAEAIVHSLRPDKPGEVRVFATNGSEFTAGQAVWMKSQLREVNTLCARGDEAQAARVLAGVREL